MGGRCAPLRDRGFRVVRNCWAPRADGTIDHGACALECAAITAVRAQRLVTPLYSPAPLGPGRLWGMLNGFVRRTA